MSRTQGPSSGHDDLKQAEVCRATGTGALDPTKRPPKSPLVKKQDAGILNGSSNLPRCGRTRAPGHARARKASLTEDRKRRVSSHASRHRVLGVWGLVGRFRTQLGSVKGSLLVCSVLEARCYVRATRLIRQPKFGLWEGNFRLFDLTFYDSISAP